MAFERVTGIPGDRGSFALRQFGIMAQGLPHLTIAVVPNPGSSSSSFTPAGRTSRVSRASNSCPPPVRNRCTLRWAYATASVRPSGVSASAADVS